MKKFYYGDKIIFFTTEKHNFGKKLQKTIIPIENIEDLKIEFKKLDSSDSMETKYFIFKNKKTRKKLVSSFFIFIKAAGGLVMNEKKEYLVIKRSGKWDLPKGKLENNEKPKTGAKREIQEETMVSPLKIKKKICHTYHIYEHKNHLVLKKTYWYKMKSSSKSKLKPQTEEDISTAKWMSVDELSKFYKNTYRSLLEVFKKENLIR